MIIESKNIKEYISNCINYYSNRNREFCESLCSNIIILMCKYPNLKIICTDSGYFSTNKKIISISKKDIEIGDYEVFIHEITHAIHGLEHSYYIPSEFEIIRNQRISNENFMSSVRDIMRYILKSKKEIIQNTIERNQLTLEGNTYIKNNDLIYYNTNKTNNDLIYNNTYKTNNTNILFKKIDNISSSTDIEELITVSNQLNKQFELLIDIFEVGRCVDEKYHILSAMESMIDSLLCGKLYSGYISNYYYLQGFGHSREYFKKNSKNSYIELLADYACLIAYNDDILIGKMEQVLGVEMIDLLNTSLNSLYIENNTNHKKRASL